MAGNNLDTYIRIRAGVEGLSDLNNLVHAIEQAGGDVTQLRQAATQLQNTWNTLTTEEQNRQLQELANTANGLARSTNNATQQMERLLGVRSNSAIHTEITQVNTALATLQQRLNAGTISQEEFNRMNQAGQQRLNTLQAELNQTSSSLNRMDTASNQAGGGIDKLTKNLMGLAGAYIGIDAVRGGVESLVETSKQLDSLNAKLEYASGGAKEAGETFSYLKDISNELGLNQMDLANGYAQLASATKNLNFTQEETRTSFEGVAKATAAMSLTADEANGVFLALSQIASKGKVSMEELRGQLGERLTPAFGIAAQAMGVTTGELEKMVESGINAKEFLPKFGAALSQSFNDQAAKNINTTTGEINLLTNTATDAKEKLLNSFAGDAISSGINLLTQGIEQASDAIDSIDPTTIDIVKNTVEQLGGVASTTFSEMMQLLSRVEENFQHIQTAISGTASEGERLTLIQSLILGINVSLGVFNDGLKTLGIAFDLAMGVSDKFFSKIAEGLSKVTFGDVSDKLKAYAAELDKSSGEAFDRAQQKTMEFKSSAVEAMDKAAEAARNNMDEVGKNAEKAAQKSIESFDKLAKAGKSSGEELAAGFSEAVSKATKPEQVDELVNKYGKLAKEGKISGEQLAQGMNEAKAKTEELEKSVGRQVPTMAELAKAGEKTAQSIKDKMADTATSLGLDFDKASLKTTQGFDKVANATKDVSTNFEELKKGGYDATNLVMQGIEAMQKQAKNKADFDTLNATIKAMGDEGKLSGDQVKQALEDSKKKATELQIGISDVEKAYKSMGIASQAELTKKAADYKQAYDQIAKDATASEAIKQQAYEKYAQAAIDANNGVMTSELKTQAAARGYADVSVENGKIATKTAEEIAQANKKSEESHKKVTQSTKETGEKAQQAQQKVASSGSGVADLLAKSYDKLTSTINSGLQSVGVTSEQVHKIFLERMKAVNSMGAFVVGDITGFSTLFSNLSRLQKQTEDNLKAFNDIKISTIAMTQSLGDAAVTTNDLGEAQLLLHRATGATYEGIAKIDNATLDNLKRQIDSTKQKFDDLSKSAKDTADGLQTQLARLKGDDTTARQLEQTKKLADLQEKLNEARKRGNAEEIAQLQRAFDLQKQINDEENRQASIKLQQEQQAKQAEAQKQAQANSSYSQPTPSAANNNQSLNAKDVANSFADLIEQAKKEGANILAQQLMDEAKRLAR